MSLVGVLVLLLAAFALWRLAGSVGGCLRCGCLMLIALLLLAGATALLFGLR